LGEAATHGIGAVGFNGAMTTYRSPTTLTVTTAHAGADYALLDSGHGRKLERFGQVIVDRPEPQALWQPAKPDAWKGAHAAFAAEDDEEKGRWRQLKATPETWDMTIGGVTLKARLMAFRHLGVFPEQTPHWQWMCDGLARVTGETPRVLNLFGYTGAASLIAAKAGAEVTHVDASKKAIQWARENQAASKLGTPPIRWMLDDARKFVAREVRRGRTYHVVLVDPPKFGRGPDGEVWDLFAHLPGMLADCVKLLAPAQARLVLTAYAIRASALSLDGLVAEQLGARDGTREAGELALSDQAGRLVGTSLYVRWASS
jgi:23S rRNA (cytosine1962-C5)-methyltransferase